jgi:ketosteroid isomerase-like protein
VPRADSEPAGASEQEELLRVVTGWAKAWSSRDVATYLAYYGVDFAPPDGLARQAWEDERRVRIAGKDRIDVRVDEPRVSVSGHTATVKFRQVYRSDRLSAVTHKTPVLSKRGGNWQISLEQANK